jgi:hypothetical protein
MFVRMRNRFANTIGRREALVVKAFGNAFLGVVSHRVTLLFSHRSIGVKVGFSVADTPIVVIDWHVSSLHIVAKVPSRAIRK